MRFRILLAVFFSIFSPALFAQGFLPVDGGMVNVGRSSVAWGDYDNDGDLDALVTGDHGTGPFIASVYRNDGGEFININAGLTGIYNSAVAWGDYDNDGDLDILACGRNSSNSKTFLYQNTSGAFIRLEAGLPDIGSDGAVAWGDYDGDNDLDILIAGSYSCRILKNDAGVFTDINAPLPAVSNCWVDWGDFDNDGDLDVFVMGDLGGILVAAIFRNNAGVFSEITEAGITPLAGGSSAWCDYDHDHDLDLLITGFNEFLEPKTTIYSNLGNMQFADVYPGLIGASLGTAAWADYNNDGEMDILLTGQNAGCGILSSIVYRNDGNNQFTDIGAPLDGAERGSAAWGDYDNDGDMDLLISGITGAGTPGTKLYSNTSGSNTFSVNLSPSVPDGLSMYIDGHRVTLGWNNSTDDHTPVAGLSYNIRVGSFPGAQDILPAMSDINTGHRLLPLAGNTGNRTDWTLNLPDGTYWWSVQAIDPSFAASEFSWEEVFTVLNVGVTETPAKLQLTIYEPDNNHILVKLPFADKACIHLSDVTGRMLVNSEFRNEICINSSEWNPGVYFLKIEVPGYPVYTAKIVR